MAEWIRAGLGAGWLTQQQRTALGFVLFLLLTGWAVKTWRAAHPPPPPPEMVQESGWY